MPEGHVIHRLAIVTNEHFAGRPVQVSSPQGRFAESAALLDGRVLAGAEAWGKHLFITFETEQPEHIIHIHLGLIGKLWFEPFAAPRGAVRLRITDGDTTADLHGPQTCRLVSVGEQAAQLAKLGPDPIRPDADPEVAWRRVHASNRSIAALLMDQKIAAGVGNIYRAEVLFRHRVSPDAPGRTIDRALWDMIWADLVELMRLGVVDGRIDTVEFDHTPEQMGRSPRVDRHGGEVYVYRRAGMPCHVCGTEIATRLLEGRNLYWCPSCQR